MHKKNRGSFIYKDLREFAAEVGKIQCLYAEGHLQAANEVIIREQCHTRISRNKTIHADKKHVYLLRLKKDNPPISSNIIAGSGTPTVSIVYPARSPVS